MWFFTIGGARAPLRAGQQPTRQRHLPVANRCRNLITTMPPRTACAAPRRQRPANEPFSAEIRKALGHTVLGRHRHGIAIPYAPRCGRRRPQKGRKAMFLRHSRPSRQCKTARSAPRKGPRGAAAAARRATGRARKPSANAKGKDETGAKMMKQIYTLPPQAAPGRHHCLRPRPGNRFTASTPYGLPRHAPTAPAAALQAGIAC